MLSGFLALTNGRAAGDRRAFPPSVAVAIKALACELPCRQGLPLSRWSVAELRQEAMASGIVAQVSGTTLWRWLSQDALRPWHHVFFITDNGSAHRGRRAAARLRAKWPNIILVHTPIHASWLNQIEVYFSIVQRKLLTPSDFADLSALKRGLIAFQHRYQRSAKPFKWTFTRRDLHVLLVKLKSHNGAPHWKIRSRNTSQ